MTNLTENPVYEAGIYKLETTDPVVGGTPGFNLGIPVAGWSNAQAQQLANRTAYLNINKQPLSNNLTSLASLTGAADRLPYFTGAGALSLAVLTAAARTFLAASTGEAQRTAMGLGTASTANVTTSSADTTAGRVMKTGDAGVLGPTPGYSDGNALPNGQGFYCWFMEGATSINLPLPTVENWQGFESGGANINRGFVIAAGLTTGNLVWRTRSAGVNGPWRTAWSNLSANAVTVDTGSFGYGTGSGATAVQPTSKATGVPLNKPSGQITMASDAIAANSAVSFTLTNDKIAANDVPKVVIKSGATAGAYVVQVDAVAAGSCRISIRNMTGGSLSETLVLQFNIEKGAIA